MTDTRRPDILDLHDNVARRLRNLETGVHPLRAITDWYESIPPTLFPKDSGGSAALTTETSGDPSLRPHYQKRAGIGSLFGLIQMPNPQTADLQDADGGLWGTLPEPMRPTLSHKFVAWATSTPYVAQVAIFDNGQLRVFGGALTGFVAVYLDGLTWPAA